MQRLLILMYHRVSDPSRPGSLENFKAHLTKLSQNYPILTPGEPLPEGEPLSLCLTFDDAYYDFYVSVFPLLQALNIKAVLGVPVKYILDDTRCDINTRLAVPYPQGLEAPIYEEKAPLCTWPELRRMAHSDHVVMASHTYSHPHLTDKGTDLSIELAHSKAQLEQNLDVDINTIIYPFGDMNTQVHQAARKLYRFGMRIGSASNHGWDSRNGLLYRVDAEHFWPDNQDFSAENLRTYHRRYWWNRLRGK